jgi:predicted permease
LVAIGFLFASWKRIALPALTEIIIYLTTPCLVFTSLITRRVVANDIVMMSAGILGVLGGVGILIRLYFALFRFRSSGFALPALFMNAGNIGIPLALFALGEPGLQRATLLFVLISFIHNTLGITSVRQI